jgi:hypothetical protein
VSAPSYTYFARLRRFCAGVWDPTLKFVNERVVLFYLARWCQKEARTLKPDLGEFSDEELADTAQNIAANLRRDGERIELLVAKNGDEWTKLLRELVACTSRHAPSGRAADLAGDALLKVTKVLLGGTKPSCASCRLNGNAPQRPECERCSRKRCIDGPSNEYVFQSPFAGWAGTIANNIVCDCWRRGLQKPKPLRSKRTPRRSKGGWCKEMEADLPALLEAIDRLAGRKQRSVMVLSLSRSDIDPKAYKPMRRLAPPKLFSEVGSERFESDKAVAEHLESTPRRVGSNRSAARRKLCEQNPRWEVLLDVLLPHSSTRRAHGEEAQDG